MTDYGAVTPNPAPAGVSHRTFWLGIGGVCLLQMLMLFGLVKFLTGASGASVPPDRIETTAAAKLANEPVALRSVANQIKQQKINPSDKTAIAQALHDARLAAATDLANALESAPTMVDGLERAAARMEKHLK